MNNNLKAIANSNTYQYLPSFDYELIDLTTISDEYLMNISIGYFLRSTFLVFKHKNDKSFIKQNTEEIFIFVEQQLDSFW